MDGSMLLVLKNLTAWYAPGKPILTDLSLALGAKEVVGLIGLNGAGKTTLIKILSGLLDRFRAESASWKGMPLNFRDQAFKRNRHIVFDEDHSFQYFTFREYLSYTASSYGIRLPEVSGLVRGFHFEEYTDILLRELSTGNQKKARLITAFALHPPLLLLDEPGNALDFQSTEYLYQLIGSYKQYGTLLFSSHILESICLTSDRVIVLEEGRIRKEFSGNEIQAGKIREVLAFDPNA